MKTLYLIRHAKSSWSNPSQRDHDRPLNDRGQRDAPRIGAFLAERKIKPDCIVSSSANRAVTTAKIIAKHVDFPEGKIETKERLYLCHLDSLLGEIQKLPPEKETVMFFGHNPTYTEIANYFSDKWIPNVPTCGVSKIEIHAENWADISTENAQLTEFWFPKGLDKK